MKIIASLNFSGNAQEAMHFYKDALSGEITGIMRYKHVPETRKNPDTFEYVFHGEIVFNDCKLFFSDYYFDGGVSIGNHVGIMIDCDSEEQIRMFFDGLRSGAKRVLMKPQETFWGAFYAQLIDKYGVGWSFNYQKSTFIYPTRF
jgi:PhnB protein